MSDQVILPHSAGFIDGDRNSPTPHWILRLQPLGFGVRERMGKAVSRARAVLQQPHAENVDTEEGPLVVEFQAIWQSLGRMPKE